MSISDYGEFYEAAKKFSIDNDRENMLKSLTLATEKYEQQINSKIAQEREDHDYSDPERERYLFFKYSPYRCDTMEDKNFSPYFNDVDFLNICCMGLPHLKELILNLWDEDESVNHLTTIDKHLKEEPDNKSLLFVKGCILYEVCDDLDEHQESSIHYKSNEITKRYENEYELICKIFDR